MRGLWRKSRRAFQPVGTDWWLIVLGRLVSLSFFFLPSCLLSVLLAVFPLNYLRLLLSVSSPSFSIPLRGASLWQCSHFGLFFYFNERADFRTFFPRKTPWKNKKDQAETEEERKTFKTVRLVGGGAGGLRAREVKIFFFLFAQQLRWQKKRIYSISSQLFFSGEMSGQLSRSQNICPPFTEIKIIKQRLKRTAGPSILTVSSGQVKSRECSLLFPR